MRMPKLSIDSLSMLYEDEQVRKFIKIMNNGSQEDDIYKHLEVCFLRAQNLKEAYIFAALSFFGLNIINLLKQYGILQEVLAKLSEQLKRYSWDGNKTALQIYRHNAKRIGNNYAEIYDNIISKISEGDAQKIFNEAKEYYLLTGVKIRKWEFGIYRQIKRQNEHAQIGNQDGVQYLLFCKAKSGDFYVGIIKDKSVCYQSQRDSFAMPDLYDKNLGENNNKTSSMYPQIQIQTQQQNNQNKISLIKSTDAPPSTKDMGTFQIQQKKRSQIRVDFNKGENLKKNLDTIQKSQSQNVDPLKRLENARISEKSGSFSNNEEAKSRYKNSQQSAEIKKYVAMNEKAQSEKAQYEKAQHEKAQHEKAQHEKAQYEKRSTQNNEGTDEMKIGSQSNKNGVKEKEKENKTNFSKNPSSNDYGNFNSSNKIDSDRNEGRTQAIGKQKNEPQSSMQQPKKETKKKEQKDYSEQLQQQAKCCSCSVM